MSNVNTPGSSDGQIYARLLSYVIPYWAAFLVSIVGFLLYSVSNVAFLQLISYIVNSLQGNDPVLQSEYAHVFSGFLGEGQTLNRTIIPVAIVAIVLSRGIGAFIGDTFIRYVSTNLVHNLRCELFDRLMNLPSSFFDRSHHGHLVAKITFNVEQVTGAATNAVRVIIREGFTVIGYLGFLLYLNWKLTLVFLVVAPLIALIVQYAGKRFRRISERIQGSMGDVTHVASEAVQGHQVVRTFGGADYERERFARVSHNTRRQSMKMVITSSITTPATQLLVGIALACLVWLVLDPASDMDPGEVVAFITAGGLLAKPIRQLSEVNAIVQKGLAAAEDIFDLFDQDLEDNSGTGELDRVEGRVEFRDVSFSYGEQHPLVLKGLSFEVQPGETIALVGKSGSGKSTLASLIPRFYSPTSGSILIDGTPIEALTLENLRKHIALVTQDVTLFNDTIANNIAYGGLKGADRNAVVEAAKKAYIWDFVSKLEQGADTLIGDNGVLLSGGQRQRLAIARAFLKDAPILILDEATSALDSESERFIQSALEEVVKGRTTFVIAHRLSTIEKADRILVIDDGRIVEEGTHAELLENNGHYAKLHNRAPGESAEDQHQSSDLSVPVPYRKERKGWDFHPLVKAWHEEASWLNLLSPLGALYEQLGRWRRNRNEKHQWRAPVPVVVVGNINIGGTGKSPLVMWLVDQLVARGFRPGVVSRGYGGICDCYPLDVTTNSNPIETGDEALMIARRGGGPVVVDPDRVSAVKYLLAHHDCDVVISDDGLQHYHLYRDVEIAVIDGRRGLGNGRCLPAGPLRESAERLEEVDFVVTNGVPEKSLRCKSVVMTIAATSLVNLSTDERFGVDQPKFGSIHAVAGIANPDRFFDQLRALGYEVLEHPFADHHHFVHSDLVFEDSLPVIMTEKDAVKCRGLSAGFDDSMFWYLEVNANLPQKFVEAVTEKMRRSEPINEVTYGNR